MPASATSLLGEALHAGFDRLCTLLQREFGHTHQVAAGKIAQTLGFSTWDALSDCALSTTSRNIDTRLECLVEGHLRHDDLAERLADAFGTTDSRMHAVLREFRDPDFATAAAAQ